jgi:hypothetical protein
MMVGHARAPTQCGNPWVRIIVATLTPQMMTRCYSRTSSAWSYETGRRLKNSHTRR